MQDLRALVVDDSKVGRLTMLKKLEVFGIKVDLAESGQQALDYLAQSRPDLIFMDHMMPDMDGFDVTRRIKAAPGTRGIPVVIISGNEEPAFLAQAHAAGAIGAITKPPSTSALEGILASLAKQTTTPSVAPTVTPPPAPPVSLVAVPPPMPTPTPTPAAAPVAAPVPAMGRAEIHALLEELLARSMEHLHAELQDKLRAELHTELSTSADKQLAAEFDAQRRTMQDWGERWRQQLELTSAGIDALRQGRVDAEALDLRFEALEQRLVPLESEAARPLPDIDALSDSLRDALRTELDQHLDQRLASGLAELHALQAGIAPLQPQLDELRELREALRNQQHAAQVGQELADLDGRLAGLSTELARLAEELQTDRADLAQRFEDMALRLEVIENPQQPSETESETDSGLDETSMLQAVDELVSIRLEEIRAALSEQLDERLASVPEVSAEESALSAVQMQALRDQADGWRAQVAALEERQNNLQAELASQSEALRGQQDEAWTSLLQQFEQQQIQLAEQASRLDAQQDQQADQESDRLLALEQRLDALAQLDVEAGAQRVLEQRFAQMREVINAALQPSYPGRPPVIDVATEPEATPPSSQDLAPLDEPFDPPLRSELEQLQARVKTLTLALVVGGGVLLVAIGVLLLRG